MSGERADHLQCDLAQCWLGSIFQSSVAQSWELAQVLTGSFTLAPKKGAGLVVG